MHRALAGLMTVSLAACAGPAVQDSTDVNRSLSASSSASRVSLALRGVRPSLEERTRVDGTEEGLERLAREWVESEGFLATMRDLHAQDWWLRVEEFGSPPAIGTMAWTSQEALRSAQAEEVTELVAEVIGSGQPYWEIVTADYTMANEVLAGAYGLAFDEGGTAWQRTHYEDGRPAAGVLSTNSLWLRHFAGEANANRSRAAFVEWGLLCLDPADRVVTGDFPDPTDDEAVADAVNHEPACASCHQSLDPIAAHFFGFRRHIFPFNIRDAFDLGCEDESDLDCYPLTMYEPWRVDEWESRGLRPPSYFGLESDHLGSLGHHIAADPRFIDCTVERFWRYLAQSDVDQVPEEERRQWTDAFIASEYDARELAWSMVTSERFLSPPGEGGVPTQTLRPEQLARVLEEVAGFEWQIDMSYPKCENHPNGCLGELPRLLGNDRGFRMLAGGVDGWRVLSPTHSWTGSKALVHALAGEAAADHVVASDFLVSTEHRRLLADVELDDQDPAVIRAQIESIYDRILGLRLSQEDLDGLVDLWSATTSGGDTAHGWRVVIAAILQDPLMGVY